MRIEIKAINRHKMVGFPEVIDRESFVELLLCQHQLWIGDFMVGMNGV